MSVVDRCAVPECEGLPGQFDNEAAAALLPAGACQRYAPLSGLGAGAGVCDRDAFHLNDTISCDTFVYETMDTIFAEVSADTTWYNTLHVMLYISLRATSVIALLRA